MKSMHGEELKQKRMPLYVPIVYFIVSLLFFTISTVIFAMWGPRLAESTSLNSGGVKTTGVVTEVRSKVMSASKSKKYHDATIEYGMDGQYYSASGIVGSKYDVGDSVAITYNPQDTSVISVDDTASSAIGSIVLAVMTGLLGVGGIIVSLLFLKHR